MKNQTNSQTQGNQAKTNQAQDFVASPCVSICCLDDQDICLGCFRHLDEITGWHSASRERRLQILANCNQRKKD